MPRLAPRHAAIALLSLTGGCALGLDLNGDPGEFYSFDTGSGAEADGGDTPDGFISEDAGEAFIPQDAIILAVSPGECIVLDGPGGVPNDVECDEEHDINVVPGAFEAEEDVQFCFIPGNFVNVGAIERPPEPCTSPVSRVVINDGTAFTATREGGVSWVVYIDSSGLLSGFDVPGLDLIDIQLAPSIPRG